MMSHAGARRLAAIAIDRTLLDAERDELDPHLATCRACRAHGDALQRDVRTLATRRHRAAPARVRREVLAALHAPYGRAVVVTRWSPALGMVAVVAALLASLVAAGVAGDWRSIRPTASVAPTPATSPSIPVPRSDLAAIVAEAGRLRLSAVGRIGTGDRVVGEALAARLEVPPSWTLGVDPGTVLEDSGWDVVTGLIRKGTGAESFAYSVAYGYRPAWVAVKADSPIRTLDALVGRRVCVVAESDADVWLAGAFELTSATPRVQPPDVIRVRRPMVSDCVAELAAGTVDAFASSAWTAGWLRDPNRRLLDAPLYVAQVVLGARRNGPDARGVIADADAAIAALRADGTLTRLAAEPLIDHDVVTVIEPGDSPPP